MFLAQLAIDSSRGDQAEGWCSPWTAAAIRACTRGHLAQVGLLADTLESADLVLLDLVDHLAASQGEALRQLRSEAGDVGAKLVVRLHGAWRSGSFDYLAAEGPDIDCVWDAADSVLVATRGHLVRLASFGGIDAERTRLAPVAFDGPSQGAKSQPRQEDRVHLLVTGETHRAALGPVLDMLSEVDPKKATYEVIDGLEPFLNALPGAGAILVPALGAFGDRSLIDAALRAGVRVIASPFAGATDRPLPPGVEVVSKMKSSGGWRAALERSLTQKLPLGATPLANSLADPAAEACARQGEILRSILGQDSHFSSQPAA